MFFTGIYSPAPYLPNPSYQKTPLSAQMCLLLEFVQTEFDSLVLTIISVSTSSPACPPKLWHFTTHSLYTFPPHCLLNSNFRKPSSSSFSDLTSPSVFSASVRGVTIQWSKLETMSPPLTSPCLSLSFPCSHERQPRATMVCPLHASIRFHICPISFSLLLLP